MTGPTDEKVRQLSAASSSTSTTPPTTTDEYIHQMVERLCPDENVVRRPRPGNFNFPPFLRPISILFVAQQ